MAEVFLDTSYAIALSAISDDFHDQAVEIAYQVETEKTRLVTTQAILLEIGNALSRQRYRRAAIALLRSLQSDPKVEIVPLSEANYTQAFQLFSRRLDKEWGLVDCLSFVTMQNRGITAALTTDDHFRQAGFQVLLRKDR